MRETKQQITQRKIRNGKRKQAEKMTVWNILKQDTVASTNVRRRIMTYSVSPDYKVINTEFYGYTLA